ncbi:MAG: NYN domain-containing protein [Candidatus Puniceispirillaceae bacterium]
MGPLPRVIAFFDGQNIYHSAKTAFPGAGDDYDPKSLAGLIAQRQGWTLVQTRFYTGVPDPKRDKNSADGWNARLQRMRHDGCVTVSRQLKYNLAGVPREKGIDVRLALDLIRLTLDRQMDVPLIFSQDSDFVEVSNEVRRLNRQGGHFVRMASAYPRSPLERNRRGIAQTDWHRFDRADWDSCQY